MSAFEDLPAKLKDALPEVGKTKDNEAKKDKEIVLSDDTADTTTSGDTESPTKKKSMFRSVGGFAKSIGLKSSSSKDSLADAVASPTKETTVSVDDDGIDMDTSDGADVDPLNFTEEEIKAARDTKALLLDPKGPHKMEAKDVTARELMLVVCNCKLRPTDAAMKYKRWHDVLKDGVGLPSLASAFDGIGE